MGLKYLIFVLKYLYICRNKILIKTKTMKQTKKQFTLDNFIYHSWKLLLVILVTNLLINLI